MKRFGENGGFIALPAKRSSADTKTLSTERQPGAEGADSLAQGTGKEKMTRTSQTIPGAGPVFETFKSFTE